MEFRIFINVYRISFEENELITYNFYTQWQFLHTDSPSIAVKHFTCEK